MISEASTSVEIESVNMSNDLFSSDFEHDLSSSDEDDYHYDYDYDYDDDEEAPNHSDRIFFSKRPRLDVGGVRPFKKLKSVKFLNSMYRGHRRVERLLSKKIASVEKLEELNACFEDLLMSLKRTSHADAEKRRLIDLAKRILRDWQFIENQVGQVKPSFGSPSEMERSDYQHAVPSDWVLESVWRDSAYEEITSIRDEHSFLVDLAYIESCNENLKENKIKGSMPLWRKKCLNLLGSSRADIGSMSKKKCYKRVMGIKQILARRDCVLDPLRLCASYETTVPNWRDKIYDEIRSMREKYSCELDEVLTEVYGLLTEVQVQEHCEFLHFLRESVNFLSTSRADLASLPYEYCHHRLHGIKLFVEDAEESVPAKHYAKLLESAGHSRRRILAANGSSKWRDVAFDKLQYKKYRFISQEYAVYLAKRTTWSQMPEFDEHCKRRLKARMAGLVDFYTMPRYRMSAFGAHEDYLKLVGKIAVYLIGCMDMMDYLGRCLGEEIKPRSRLLLIPKAQTSFVIIE